MDSATRNRLDRVIVKNFLGIAKLLPGDFSLDDSSGIKENIIWLPEEEMEDGIAQARIMGIASDGIQECPLLALFTFTQNGHGFGSGPTNIKISLENYPEAGKKSVFPIQPRVENMEVGEKATAALVEEN